MTTPLHDAVPQIDSTRNYYLHEGESFRYQSMLYYWPPTGDHDEAQALLKVTIDRVLGDQMARMRPIDVRVVDPSDKDQPFLILRETRVVGDIEALKPGDILVTAIPAKAESPDRCVSVSVLFGAEKTFANPVYGELESRLKLSEAVTDTSIDAERGLLDYTGPVDLRQPASLIQMDLIYSARWNLWYEFAHWAQAPGRESVDRMTVVPVNPLWISAQPGSQSTCFNMDDVPRFPIYYMRWFRASGDRRALHRARQGLEAILRHTRDDGTMPYLLSPWNGEHRDGADLFEVYHSMRAVAEGIPVFARDAAMAPRLEEAYERFRGFVFSHLKEGLFQSNASANGALLEAVYNRWLDTRAERELKDMRALADAICSETGRAQKDDYGEYLPWVPLGLILAYDATQDSRYRTEAQEWMDGTLAPSLKQDRRYYRPLPNLVRSEPGKQNALQVWYHTDALLTMYRTTGEQRYYDLAAWEFGDYYDLDRYTYSPGSRIVDTGNQYTEVWGAACAEDALRMTAKYIWQVRYPKLRAEAREHRAIAQ